TSGTLGGLLSPDPDDVDDERPITDFARIIANRQVCYIGLDSLSDNMVGSAIGSMFVSDMTAVSGDRYNFSEGADTKPVNLIIDEAAELV
ncbi:conjugal transfer protein, partial [Xanthomonas citri pv. citri]|nr:conjugal transfer protein [Xanthomonas citri pv. citri]